MPVFPEKESIKLWISSEDREVDLRIRVMVLLWKSFEILICCDLLIEAFSFSVVLNEQLQTFSNQADA